MDKMFGGMDPSKVKGIMKKMGISQEELRVKKVIFEMNEKKIVIEEPSVIKISMQGQVSYQVTGDEFEEPLTEEKFTNEDIELVVQKTGKSREKVVKALEDCDGDIAKAIIMLKGQ